MLLDDTPYLLSQELELLKGQCRMWLNAWASWPRRVASILDFTGQIKFGTSYIKVVQIARLIESVVDNCDPLNPRNLLEFTNQLRPLVEAAKQLPDASSENSLFSELHYDIENVSNLLANPSLMLSKRVKSIRCLTENFPVVQKNEVAMACIYVEALIRDYDVRMLQAAAKRLEKLCDTFKATPVKPQLVSDWAFQNRHWIIVVAEDDPVWQEHIEWVLTRFKEQIPPEFDLKWFIEGDAASAKSRLQQLTSKAIGHAKDKNDASLLLLLDMGLPKNSTSKAARGTGLELLELARQPNLNVPVVVLTTPANFLDDHLAASLRGVTDYLPKEANAAEHLLATLHSRILSAPRRRLRLDEALRQVYVDDVAVPLNPKLFQTLSVLVDEAPHSVTPEVAVNLLEEKYGGYLRAPNLKCVQEGNEDTEALNFRRLWAAAKRKDQESERLKFFLEEKLTYRLRQTLNGQLAQRGIDFEDTDGVVNFLNQHYGEDSTFKVFDSDNIEKHVWEIRSAFIIGFGAAERTIQPEKEVLFSAGAGDDFAYEIIAEIERERDEDSATPRLRSPRILVVEDDEEVWQPAIVALLHRYGYETTVASNQQNAVDLARTFRPHILCLDMQLPIAAGDSAFSLDAGLDALEAIQLFLPQVRAVALTDFANQDLIRNRAQHLGVRATDFVPKQTSIEHGWEADLLLKLHRIEREISQRVILPVPQIPALPYLQFWRSRPGYIEVFDRSWQAKPNEFKILQALAENACLPLSTEELMFRVYGDLTMKEALTQVIKRLRPRIAHEWFELEDYSAKSCDEEARRYSKAVAEAVLANDAKAGWVLNARVIIHD